MRIIEKRNAIIHGNLSIDPGVNSDGSLEVAGSLYVDNISRYTTNSTQGLVVSKLYINSTECSIGISMGSLITDGGITIRNTSNVFGPDSGGALTVFGGTSIIKDLIVGGSINVSGNTIFNLGLPNSNDDAASKEYVDSVAGRAYGDYTTGQLIVGGTVGTQIRGFPSLTFIDQQLVSSGTSGSAISIPNGGLTIKGYPVYPRHPLHNTEYSAFNNQGTPVLIQGGDFSDTSIKLVVLSISVAVVTNSATNLTIFTVRYTRHNGFEFVDESKIGANSNINFIINPSNHMLYYTSGNTAQWISTRFTFIVDYA